MNLFADSLFFFQSPLIPSLSNSKNKALISHSETVSDSCTCTHTVKKHLGHTNCPREFEHTPIELQGYTIHIPRHCTRKRPFSY